MGIITDSVKRYVPASYLALVGATNSYNYTLSDLQQLADFVQFRYYTTVAGATLEDSVWNPLQSEFLGVLTTLEFIPAAIDYWGDQIAAQSTAPTSESISYFDRRGDLWKLYDKLVARAAELGPELGVGVKVRGLIPLVSYGDNGRGILLTPDPQDFPPSYARSSEWSSIDWVVGNSWDSEDM